MLGGNYFILTQIIVGLLALLHLQNYYLKIGSIIYFLSDCLQAEYNGLNDRQNQIDFSSSIITNTEESPVPVISEMGVKFTVSSSEQPIVLLSYTDNSKTVATTTTTSSTTAMITSSVQTTCGGSTSEETSVTETTSSSIADCPPLTDCTAGGSACECNFVPAGSQCVKGSFVSLQYLISTNNTPAARQRNKQNLRSAEIINNFNRLVVSLFDPTYYSICSLVNGILDEGERLAVTIFVFTEEYSPVLSSTKIAKSLIFQVFPDTNKITDINVINYEGACFENISYPITTQTGTECECLIKPNLRKFHNICLFYARFCQTWVLFLSDNVTRGSYIVSPGDTGIFCNTNNSISLQCVDQQAIEEVFASMFYPLFVFFPQIISVKATLVGPNTLLAEYKITGVNDYILNGWENTVNIANLTDYANFSFGSSILVSVIDTDVLKDVNECKMENVCDINAICVNTFGSYFCVCKANFVGDGVTCTPYTGDINYCKNNQQQIWILNELYCFVTNSINYYKYRDLAIVMTIVACLSILILAGLFIVTR